MFARTLMSCALVLSATAALAQSAATPPQRFVIEREIPGASKMSPDQLRDAAKLSNRVLREMGPEIQWVQSFVAGDSGTLSALTEELLGPVELSAHRQS